MRETESTPLIPELADLRGAARDRAIIAEARVVLAGRLGVRPDEALQHLIWLARDLDVELKEAAAMVTGVRGEAAPEPEQGGIGAHAAVLPQTVTPLVDAFPAPEADVAEDAGRLAAVPDDPAARAVLDVAINAAAHLVPVRGADGKVLDFLYANLNESARDLFGRGAAELAGQRLLRMDPGSALLGLFPAYVEVLETGRPYERGPFEFSTAQEGLTRTARMSVRCVAVPTGVCTVWHYYDDEDRMRRRLERAGRLASLGFGEYDLATDELQWTPQMAANYGLTAGPPLLDELSKVVVDEDRPMVEERFQTLLSRREPVELEHRVVAGDGEQRHLWVFAEPVLDGAGRPVSVNILSQDITRRRGIEKALVETRREILRQQAQVAQEREVAVTLRRAILPDPEDLPDVPGLGFAVRSLAAESAARIGGDWFVSRPLPDQRTLLAIGDVAGHGLPAAAAMARTRNGLLGLAYTGECPGRLVGWLNEMVGELVPERVATGTALVALYDPGTRLMEWTSAGHLPPILVRDGQASPLRVTPEPMLGAVPGYGYSTISTPMLPGDLLFLYTDGLVERRDVDLEERIERLTEVLSGCAGPPDPVVEEVLEQMEYDRTADDTTLFAMRIDSF
ncbi:SpoIIE family protein phosphatase [Actinomadura sp. 9N407]|uniref:SpoIIE family protein phosphatase n=1 Tax=Actinomadura sp. 9N407 TaxID=3375154 RepID=UPI0037A9692D